MGERLIFQRQLIFGLSITYLLRNQRPFSQRCAANNTLALFPEARFSYCMQSQNYQNVKQLLKSLARSGKQKGKMPRSSFLCPGPEKQNCQALNRRTEGLTASPKWRLPRERGRFCSTDTGRGGSGRLCTCRHLLRSTWSCAALGFFCLFALQGLSFHTRRPGWSSLRNNRRSCCVTRGKHLPVSLLGHGAALPRAGEGRAIGSGSLRFCSARKFGCSHRSVVIGIRLDF